MSETIAELRGVTLGYRHALFSGVDLQVTCGEFLGVIGPNGGGKSTLVKTLCGILDPLVGEVHFPGGRPRMAYVPQRDRLDPAFPLRALDVVRLALMGELRGFQRLGRSHTARAEAALEQVGMLDKAGILFRELSGGQFQRVLLARALVTNPELLILDEPTAGLDQQSNRTIHELVHGLNDRGVSVVLTSHDLNHVCDHATRVLYLDHERDQWKLGAASQIDALVGENEAAHG